MIKPSFITTDPATSGAVTIHIRVSTSAELRQAAAWLIEMSNKLDRNALGAKS